MTGKDLIVVLSHGGTAVAGTRVRSQSLQTSCASIEKASSTQQDWEEVVAGRKSWSLTVNYLVLAGSQVKDVLKVGQSFGITVKEDGSSTNVVSGTALLVSVRQDATLGNLAQGSFEFRGNGALA